MQKFHAKFYLLILAFILVFPLVPSHAETYAYSKSDDIFYVDVQIQQATAFVPPIHQYKVERVGIEKEHLQAALNSLGQPNLRLSVPQYTDGGVTISNPDAPDAFTDVEGKGAPAFVSSQDPLLLQHQEAASKLLDSLHWPRQSNVLTAMTLNDLAAYYQDRLGPGVYQEKSAILQMTFKAWTADGKSYISYQSSLDGYPLASGVKAANSRPLPGEEPAGTVAAFLIGSQGEVLHAFLPSPFRVVQKKEITGQIYDWREAIPTIMDKQIAFYKYFIKENRDFFPEIDAFWAQNKTQIVLSVKRVEAAYQVNTDMIAIPVWQIIVEADFIYSGEDAIQVVRNAMPDIEEHTFFVDAQNGQITQ